MGLALSHHANDNVSSSSGPVMVKFNSLAEDLAVSLGSLDDEGSQAQCGCRFRTACPARLSQRRQAWDPSLGRIQELSAHCSLALGPASWRRVQFRDRRIPPSASQLFRKSGFQSRSGGLQPLSPTAGGEVTGTSFLGGDSPRHADWLRRQASGRLRAPACCSRSASCPWPVEEPQQPERWVAYRPSSHVRDHRRPALAQSPMKLAAHPNEWVRTFNTKTCSPNTLQREQFDQNSSADVICLITSPGRHPTVLSCLQSCYSVFETIPTRGVSSGRQSP